MTAAAEMTDEVLRAAERAHLRILGRGTAFSINVIAEAILAERPVLQPISTAPLHQRIMVAGWQPEDGDVDGYWWFEEKIDLEPDETATHWFPLALPVFPAGPKGGA